MPLGAHDSLGNSFPTWSGAGAAAPELGHLQQKPGLAPAPILPCSAGCERRDAHLLPGRVQRVRVRGRAARVPSGLAELHGQRRGPQCRAQLFHHRCCPRLRPPVQASWGPAPPLPDGLGGGQVRVEKRSGLYRGALTPVGASRGFAPGSSPRALQPDHAGLAPWGPPEPVACRDGEHLPRFILEGGEAP